MFSQLHSEILERIAAIDWFHKCGQPDNLPLIMPHFYVNSWQKVKKLYLNNPQGKDVQWRRIELAAEENIYLQLGIDPMERGDDEWRRFIAEALDYVKYYVRPKFQTFADANGLDHRFVYSADNHIGFSIVEYAISEIELPVRFFSELLTVYEAGHFPCGWKGGDWEHGRLAIF